MGGRYQGYHVQRYQRLIGEGAQGEGKTGSSSAPLRVTSRMTNGAGYDEFILPKPNHLQMHQKITRSYFHDLHKIRDELDAILKKIAVNNSVVVLTVVIGQLNYWLTLHVQHELEVSILTIRGFRLASYYSREVRAQCCRVTDSIMLLDVSTHNY